MSYPSDRHISLWSKHKVGFQSVTKEYGKLGANRHPGESSMSPEVTRSYKSSFADPVFQVKPVAYLLLFISKQIDTMEKVSAHQCCQSPSFCFFILNLKPPHSVVTLC